MTDPIMLSVASAVASKATEAVAEGGRAAITALVRLVREHFAKNKASVHALDRAQGAPQDPMAIEQLAQVLEEATAADADFGRQIRMLWPQAQIELSAGDGGVVNTNSGAVGGHLIQTRDLHVQGGLHLGDIQRS